MTDQQKLDVQTRFESAIATEAKLRNSTFNKVLTGLEGVALGVVSLWVVFESPTNVRPYVLLGMCSAAYITMAVSRYFQAQAMAQLRRDIERMHRADYAVLEKVLAHIEEQHAKGEPATKESTH